MLSFPSSVTSNIIKLNELRGLPSINGLDFDSLVKALLAYKKKERDNPVMQMVAGRLDHNQIFSLAAYFSKLNPKK